MNDFISREAVIKAVDDYTLTNCPKYMHDWATNLKRAILEDVKSDIDNIPDADVQPVKCGKWIDVTETVVSGKTKDGRELEINIVSGKCSCCQHYAEQVNILPPIMKYSICPNCGALMQDE